MSNDPRRIAILATYNERENILSMIEQLLALPVGLSVLVVDDRSPDGTAQAIREYYPDDPRVLLIEREQKLGYGTAMVEGFQRALSEGFEVVVTLDADFSHDPEAVPNLVRAIEQEAAVAIGSRYKDGVRVLNWPPRRLVLSLFANRYVQTILNIPIRDCTSGFRAYSRQVLESIDIQSLRFPGYAFLVEVLYRTILCGFPIQEVPIIYTERREGQSKMSKLVILESIGAPWRMLLSRGWLRKRIRPKQPNSSKFSNPNRDSDSL